MKTFNRIMPALLGFAAVLVTTASAATISGSIALGVIGAVTYTGASLSVATDVTLPIVFVSSATGDFDCVTNPGADCVPVGSLVDVTPNPFAVPPLVYPDFLVFDATGMVDRYHFDSLLSITDSTSADDLTIKMTGTFTDTGLAESDTASVILGLTQAGGPPNAVSFSGTFTTPQAFQLVPEPGTWALFGSGLIAMVVAMRRKVRKG